MRDAPTRRPPSYPDRRRPSRGRRPVAARPIRDDLKTAAELLTTHGDALDRSGKASDAEQYYSAASAVRAVTAPGGWAVLKDSDSRAGGMTNLAVMMDEDLRSRLEDAAQVFGRPLEALAAEALAAVVEGRFVPPKAYVGQGVKKNLNLSVPVALKDQAAAKVKALRDEVGYRVSLASTITWYLVDELGVDLPATDVIRLIVPKPFAEHIQVQADMQGATLEEVLAGQIRALVAGTYSPKLPDRAREGGVFAATTGTSQTWGKDLKVVKLTLRLDAALLDELRERTEDITRAAGWQAAPGMVAIAMLRDWLGEPE